MPDGFGLFLLGLSYGATVCSVTCLPYLGPYLMGTGKGFADGVFAAFAFLFGKLCTYAALGGVAAFIGRTFAIGGTQKMIMGMILIGTALTLPLVARGGCRRRCQVIGKRVSLFMLGAASSLVPCPPLAAIFLLAAGQGTVLGGMAYGLLYGAGLLLSPMLIAGGGVALISQNISREAQGFAPYMQGLSMLIMVVMAVEMMV